MTARQKVAELEKSLKLWKILLEMEAGGEGISPGCGFTFLTASEGLGGPPLVSFGVELAGCSSIRLLLSEDRARHLLRSMRDLQLAELEDWKAWRSE